MTSNDKPLFSVIIPTYNHAPVLKRCLESVINQTFSDWEAIVVNNFSEDNTIEVVENMEDSRIQLVNFRNSGIIAASRNEGIRLARGDYIAFLDSDDWWYPKKLEAAALYFPKTDVVYHNLDIYTKKGRKLFIKMRGKRLKKPVFRDLMLNKNALPNSSVVVKKSIINEVGALGENRALISVEDFDLWLRISKITENFSYISKSLGAYWMGESNITEVSEKQIQRLKAIYNLHKDSLSSEEKKQVDFRVSYLSGKHKAKMGLFREAQKLFQNSVKSKKFTIKLKSVIFITLVQLQRLRLIRHKS